MSGAFQSSCRRHSGVALPASLLSGPGSPLDPLSPRPPRGTPGHPARGCRQGDAHKALKTEGSLATSSPICTCQHWPPSSAAEAHCPGPNQPQQALVVRLWACNCPLKVHYLLVCYYVIFGCIEWHAASWFPDQGLNPHPLQ